ncbi:MAG: FG-GAP-like repeat-containing protein, partial [Planctomycetota bacterium]
MKLITYSVGLIAAAALGAPAVSGFDTAAEQANVAGFYGSLGTTVPIALPSFPHLAPSLELRYNSTGKNSILGVGWSMNGLSAIQRGGARGGSAGNIGGTAYFLDGQELIPFTGLGGTHATEIQSFMRISQVGNNWEVTNKEGTVSVYEPLFQTASGTFRWHVTSVTDTHGNSVQYHYSVTGSPTESVSIARISYNGVDVHFRMEDRPDNVSFGNSDSIARVTKRVSAIDIIVGGRRLRTYNINYAQSPLTGRSMLASIQQYGRDAGGFVSGRATTGTSLPAVTYEYAPGGALMEAEGPWSDDAPAGPIMLHNIDDIAGRVRTGDFNGDGFQDMLYGPDPSHNWYVALSRNGQSFEDPATGNAFALWADVNYPNWGSNSETPARTSRIKTGDVDGDGRTDIVMGPDGAGDWYVMTSNGSSFDPPTRWITGDPYSDYWLHAPRAAKGMHLQDINSDGMADLLLGPDGSGIMRGFISNGVTFNQVNTDWGFHPSLGTYANDDDLGVRIRLVDVTGNGRPDLLSGPSDTGEWYVYENGGSSFHQERLWLSNSYGGYWANHEVAEARIRNADLNGDGLTDILAGPDHTGKFYASLNNGSGFESIVTWGDIPALAPWSDNDDASADMLITDINTDGAADVLIGPLSGSANYVAATGSPDGLTYQGVWGTNAFPGIEIHSSFWHNTAERNRKRFADVTGDGIGDVVYGPDKQGRIFVARMGARGNKGDLLQAMTNGIGGRSDILYEASSEWDHNTLPVGMIVNTVGSVTTIDGRGASSTVSYQYDGGLWSWDERRFLGFHKVTSVLDAEGTYIETYYLQRNGSISKPLRTQTYGSNSALLGIETYLYTENAAPPYTSNLTTRLSLTLEDGGAGTLQTRIDYAHDMYGNVFRTIDHGDVAVTGDETVELVDFYPNMNEFITGKPAM